MESVVQAAQTTLVIHVPKELDHHQAESIRKETDRWMSERNIRTIVFDFRQTGFMDSAGIGLIMGRYQNMKLVGGKVTAIHVHEQVRKILTLSGLYKVIAICEGEAKEAERGRSE